MSSKQHTKLGLVMKTGGLAFLVLALCARAPALGQNAEQVYLKSVNGVVWIVNHLGWFREAQGTGFLVDKDRKLVVTCQHVTNGQWYVDVYFPIRDAHGRVIQDQNYYKQNKNSLERQGYATRGRVVAYDEEKDLAVLQLAAIPKDAVALNTAFLNPAPHQSLHIIGHPANRPLWSYSPGIEAQVINFQQTVGGKPRDFRAVVYKSAAFHGNSGGPVLDDIGCVVGVNSCKGGVGGMLTVAVHWKEIDKLVETIQPYHVVGIENGTWSQIIYQIRWGFGEWNSVKLPARGKYVHWYRGAFAPRPQIRFDESTAPGIQEKLYDLNSYLSYLGKNVQPDFDRDAREYVFRWKDSKTLDLYFQR